VARTVGVIGLGYVGLTLTAALARKGFVVHGVDVDPAVVEALRQGRPHLYEPGVAEAFAEHLGTSISVASALPPNTVDAAVICVSTPVDEHTHRPELANLAAAARHVADRCGPQTLVVVRSTVPVGSSRGVVLPPLLDAWGGARLVMAPERTIQGQALRELVELPQVVGGLDDGSREYGLDLFGQLAREVVPVSTLEAAELVKLANNCHTDLIYSYGNEIALIAERHGLDPLEVIRAANVGYPRPDLARPGYVGGGCLSKDPYIMISSAVSGADPRPPFLVGQARALNEYLPVHVAATVVDLVRQECGATQGGRLAVLGWAYKGWPPTDDMRGTPVTAMLPAFAEAGLTVLGHDPVVHDEVIRRYGGTPVTLDEAFRESDAVLVLNDHQHYRTAGIGTLLGPDARARLVFDSWRILDERAVTAAGVRYAGIGYLPARPAVRAVS
jgi:UDP-N-acetyl-D-mannosaminuronic acid dehydrogenase